jgi:hypothetical protein
MREWAPYHFLLMVEGLREFRDEILPPGAQAVAGTLAHQELAEQTPEGNLRAWVEGRLEHVQAVDKDRGSKLEELPSEYLRAGIHARRVLKRSSGRLRSRPSGGARNRNRPNFLYFLSFCTGAIYTEKTTETPK